MENLAKTPNQPELFERPRPVRRMTREQWTATKTAALATLAARTDLSQADVARMFGVSPKTVSAWVRNERNADEPEPMPEHEPEPPVSLPEPERTPQPPTFGAGYTCSPMFGTARQTAAELAQRQAVAKVERAAKEIELGARSLQDAARSFDALLNDVFLEGWNAGYARGKADANKQ